MNDIVSQFADIFRTQTKYYDDLIATHVSRLTEIDNILPPSSIFFMVTNAFTFKYEFLSQNIEHALGLAREDVYSGGVQYLVAKVHHEDAQIWISALRDLMQFCITEVPVNKRTRLNVQYNYRFEVKPGKVLNIVENQIPLELDESGKPIIFFGHITVYHDEIPHPIKASVRLLNDLQEYETIFFKNYGIQQLLGGLSNREQDIMRLLALGKTSKEIAKKFYISSHTVDTHRRNILRKLSLTSTSDIITYCQGDRWL